MANKDNNQNRFRWKMKLVYGMALLLGVMCCLKILHLVIFQRTIFEGSSDRCLDKTKENWKDSPLAQDTTCNCFVINNDVKPIRGEIFDDQGRLLSGNFTVFDVTVDGTRLQPKVKQIGKIKTENDTIYCGNGRKISRKGEPAKVDALIQELAEAFYQHFHYRFPNKSVTFYKQQFSKAIKDCKNVFILGSNITKETQWVTAADTAFIKTLPLLGRKKQSVLNCSQATVRINPYGEMARRTIGLYTDNQKFGVENAFNSYLYGENGSRKYVVYNRARIPLGDYVEPTEGYNVHTTINLEMQNIVHNELQKTLISSMAEWGCAVVMETATGEIKAIANLTRDEKNENVYRDGVHNYLLTAMVEPGSTFKLASLLAYLENVKDDTTRIYPVMAHTFSVPNRSGTRVNKYFKVDKPGHAEEQGKPIDVFQRSSNVGIASMIFDVYSYNGYKQYLNKIDSMFITTSFSTQLGKVNAPAIKRNAKDFHSYYNACFGAGFSMTPVQTLVYYNAVANGGKMILPLFVKYITNQEDTIERFEAEVINEQFCKPSTISRARKYLEAVVYGDHGTARGYRDPAFRFAGKTGTRDIWNEALGQYDYHKNSVSFCGYFPADKPKYTCLVFMYNVPQKSYVAVGVFARIAKAILNSASYSAVQSIDQSKEKTLPAVPFLQPAQLQTILTDWQIPMKVPSGSPYVTAFRDNNNQPQLKSVNFDSKQPVPNVMNMLASDAVYELSRKGYKTRLVGRGIVRRTEVDAATKTVTLYLSN